MENFLNDYMIYIILGITAITLIGLIIVVCVNRGLNREVNALVKSYQNIQGRLDDMNQDDQKMVQTVQNSFGVFSEIIARNQKDQAEALNAQMKQNSEALDRQMKVSNDTVDKRLQEMHERLEEVYKNLGEMKSLAGGVDDLKKVLSNVKTRGILGEVQLKAILEQILSPEQYAENVVTVPGSTERVEFAVKLPGDNETPIWLPIDSKFPGERYAQLRDAQELGSKEEVEQAWKALETVLKQEAKDIKTKYVSTPYTTDFGIMFLPFEGLYAEVINRGMVEVLQREYKINIAGPTTMAALLNSLQMGFKTLAIQKHSSEVWEILGAVKTEFETFDSVLKDTKQRLHQADDDLDKLIGTRTRAIERKLRSVEALEKSDADKILELTDLE